MNKTTIKEVEVAPGFSLPIEAKLVADENGGHIEYNGNKWVPADEASRSSGQLQQLKIELVSIRSRKVNDRFDEVVQLRRFRELVDRWVPRDTDTKDN